MNSILIFHVVYFTLFVYVNGQEITVSTKAGEFIGTTEETTFNNVQYTVKQFLGIPYAKPPVGELRFRKPEPMSKLQSPFRATTYGFICPQIILPSEPLVGVQDEDCLHLNIFVPTNSPNDTNGHAVMVWIHGGGFILGSSDEFDSKILAGFGNVIVVTINYRLGPLGFFSTMDSSCPGNFGLWDQMLALNWVKDNIGSFGGDIDRITVFGESAGAISGEMLGMKRENIGLFQRIIASSGSPSVRSMNCSRNTLTGARVMAGKVGCNLKTTEQMIDCLRNITWQEYMGAINALSQDSNSIEFLIFDPVVDGDFIKDEPRDLYRKAKTQTIDELEVFKYFDLLSGMNANEGGYYMMYFVEDVDLFMPTREEMRNAYLPAAMTLVYNRTFPDAIMQLIENEYTNWSSPYDYRNIRQKFAKIFGDTGFAVTSVEFSRLHLTSPPTSKTYVYKFMPKPSKRSRGSPEWMQEANHGDDIRFVFGFQDQPDAEQWEIELSKHMMRYWTNFAKTGDPNKPNHPGPVWLEYDLTNQHYMELDRDLGENGGKQYVFAQELNFWLEVFPDIVRAADFYHVKKCWMMTSSGDIVSNNIRSLLILLLAIFFK